ncbi:MAG TPA: YdeI/OmpD-associated family protein [Devosia sp.]|nr:YdeI/OmpD-associated family protein [Devosia sp.]
MDADIDTSRMTRQIYEMPEDIRAALKARGVLEAYRVRPAYQQNDYVGWITRSKRPETRQKRLDQMLDELERGGVYMHMKWNG